MSAFSGISLDINLSPSRRFAGFLSAGHLGAAVCVILSSAPLFLKLIFPPACAVSLVYCLRRYALLKHSRSPRRLVIGHARRQLIFNSGDSTGPITLRPGTVNARNWVILRLAVNRSRHIALPLAPDMMNPEQWRRLRVWLNVESDINADTRDKVNSGERGKEKG